MNREDIKEHGVSILEIQAWLDQRCADAISHAEGLWGRWKKGDRSDAVNLATDAAERRVMHCKKDRAVFEDMVKLWNATHYG